MQLANFYREENSETSLIFREWFSLFVQKYRSFRKKSTVQKDEVEFQNFVFYES